MLYTNDYNEVVSIIIMLILYLLVYLFMISKIKISKKINMFILIAIILRITLTITDVYFFPLPYSGGDSVTFEFHAYQLLQGNISLKSYTFDNYPKLIYFVYLVIGRKPIVIRAINGVLSMLTGALIYKSINLAVKNIKKASIGMLIFLLFPNSLAFSSVILRESSIAFFSTLSIYYFIKYVQDNKVTDILKSYVFILAGSLLHAGIIFISIPYVYYILKVKTKDLSDKMKKGIIYIALILIVFIIFGFPEIFLGKLSFLKSPKILFDKLNGANMYGVSENIGSAYLVSFRIYSFKDLILYLPLKVFYFLFSPMFWNIRGILDIGAVILDSVFYIVFILKIFLLIKKLKKKGKKDLLLTTLMYSLILVMVVYAMGTIASGTAIRHRYKLLSLIIIIIMYLEDRVDKELINDLNL